MFWSLASFTQHLSKQSDFHSIILAVTMSRKHVLRTKLYEMQVICSLSSKALKSSPCFAGCPANGSWGELSFGKLSAPAQRSQPPEIFSDGILRISWMCCSLVYEFLICDLMAVPSLQKVVSVEFRSLGGWVCFFFLLKSGFSEDVLVTDCRYKSTQLADNKEELYSVFSTEMISFVGIR